MQPKRLNLNSPSTHTNPKHSILNNPMVSANRIISRLGDLASGEETEIAAQISLPQEGGWGWVVVTTAFCSVFLLDGITYTYGSLLHDVARELDVKDSWIALINSTQLALYYVTSPLASAFINRFGFRVCIMTGSIICSFSQFTAYFSSNYAALFLFYGVFNGIGSSLIQMSAGLIVGFYFVRLRSITLAITTCGTSIGIMTFFPMNVYLVSLAGWRSTILLHSGLLGIIYYLGMAFKPVLSITVAVTEEESARTVTYLPKLSTIGEVQEQPTTKAKQEGLAPTNTERFFGAVSNVNFPTAAEVVDEEEVATTSTGQEESSTARVSKLTLTAITPEGGISRRQLRQVQSILSRTNIQDNSKINFKITVNMQPSKKRSCWERLCHWEPHLQSTRPMYRDDAFYSGYMKELPAYRKSMVDTPAGTRTGLEYQLAVSRAITVGDLQEKRGVFTVAVRRVLATMMDPSLLKKSSFKLLCCSCLLSFLGLLVPYVFLKDRNHRAGLDDVHCSIFISVMGGSNACGKLFLGFLATKIDPLKIFISCGVIAGAITIASGLSYTVVYQYAYCAMFGFFVAGITSVRSVLLVSLYGLDKLTNSTGMMLIFAGVGILFCTPVAGILKENFGYNVAFYVAGLSILSGGLILLPVIMISVKEKKKDQALTGQRRMSMKIPAKTSSK